MNQSTKPIQKEAKGLMAINRKVGRAITNWGTIEKFQYFYGNIRKKIIH